MKKLLLILVFSSLLFFGCLKETPKPSPSPINPSPLPSPWRVIEMPSPEPSVTPSAYAVAEGFNHPITDMAYKGTTLEFTIAAMPNENAFYVVGATLNKAKGIVEERILVKRGESGSVVFNDLPLCEPGTEFSGLQLVVSYNPFGGPIQGKFDIGSISGICS